MFFSIIIITDSLSSIHAIADPYSTHPVVTRIFTLLSTFQAISYKVTLLRVPSHKSIQGNNNVDITAKSASKKPLIQKSDTTSLKTLALSLA